MKRFLDKVDKTDKCWLWTASCARGYGQFFFNGRMHPSHRISYMIHVGDIPVGLDVLHSCDNTRCVNPDHLFVGTAQDNMSDKVKKNRQAKGSGNGNSKLTEEQVREIMKSNDTQSVIAKRFGTTQQNVSVIKSRKFWKEVV